MMIRRLEQIHTIGETLPKKQANACRYICESPKEIASMGAAEFAVALGLGTATVIRLMRSLGFSNYPDFRKELRRALAVNDSYSKFWDARLNLITPEGGDERAIYHEVLDQSAALTKEMNEQVLQRRTIDKSAPLCRKINLQRGCAADQAGNPEARGFVSPVGSVSASKRKRFEASGGDQRPLDTPCIF